MNTIIYQQRMITALLQITLIISEQYKTVCKNNKHLANSLHKEIDYSEKLKNKIKKLKQRKVK